jgi:hypothetical protein
MLNRAYCYEYVLQILIEKIKLQREQDFILDHFSFPRFNFFYKPNLIQFVVQIFNKLKKVYIYCPEISTQ